MRLQKKSIGISLFAALLLLVLLFPYTNCSNVNFDPQQQALNESHTDQENPEDSTPTIPPPEEQQDVADRLPPGELESPRPITDLEDDPTLADLYRCSDGSSIMICHFPNNVDGRTTQCVGAPAVRTHYSHIRYYDVDGITHSIQDYLGPCRN